MAFYFDSPYKWTLMRGLAILFDVNFNKPLNDIIVI